MKDLKDIILDRRIRNLEIEGKQVPDKYISVFNSYLEQIAESLTDYTKQVRKEVCEEIREKLNNLQPPPNYPENDCEYGFESCVYEIEDILDQIQGD